MRDSLKQRTALYAENKEQLRSAFRWESSDLHALCAVLCASKNLPADLQAIEQCMNMIKAKVGFFSSFRGFTKMVSATFLSFSENPEERFDQMVDIYDGLKEVFGSSEYLTIASYIVADLAAPQQFSSIVQRTKAIYDYMKQEHPFLTTGEDSPFAALLALSPYSDAYLEKEIELCYRILKPSFFSGNAVQSLSHVLALVEGEAEEKCKKTLRLFEILKENGYRYGTSYELATLGVLAMLPGSLDSIAWEIMETDDALKAQKGFGMFGISQKERLMYAGILSMSESIDALQITQPVAVTQTLSLALAQQIAICASVAASSAAAAAATAST